MPDTKTTAETLRSPIDGTELVRLATPGANWKVPLSTITKIPLTTPTNFYVDVGSGSDITGDGSIGAPWKTIQHAVDTVCGTYLINAQVEINLAAGTYPESVFLPGYTSTSSISGAFIEIQGASSATVIVDANLSAIPTGACFWGWGGPNNANGWAVTSMTLQNSGLLNSGGNPSNALVMSFAPSIVYVHDLTLGAHGSGAALAAYNGGNLQTYGTLTITGTGGAFLAVRYQYSCIDASHTSLVLSVDPLWPIGCLYASRNGSIHTSFTDGASITGTSSGPRYNCVEASRIINGNADAPGASFGTVDATSIVDGYQKTGIAGFQSTGFTGDSGSGGTYGFVPAPASGDAAASKFLKADGTWQVAGVAEDTIKNILALTPTTGKMAWATDIQQLLIANGTHWYIDDALFDAIPVSGDPDIGSAAWSNRAGYGRNYVTDKNIVNCTIGYGSDPGTTNGQIRFSSALGAFGAYEQYSSGAWHPVVVGLVLTEVANMSQAITQTPIGKTEPIVVFNGDSIALGLNGLPLEQGYVVSMGSNPPRQLVSGGTF